VSKRDTGRRRGWWPGCTPRFGLTASCMVLLFLFGFRVKQISAPANTTQGTAQAANFPPPHWRRNFGAPPGLSYVGSQVCAKCHSSIAQTQVRTPMGRAASRASDSSILSAGTVLTYRDGPYLLRIEREGAQEVYSVNDGQSTVSASLLWAFGLGNAGQTYIFQRQGTYYESRVSFYNEIQGLDLTMGHSRQLPASLSEVLGRPISKDELIKCFTCHTSEDVFDGKLQMDRLHPGVTCENCHGPGSEHILTAQIEPVPSGASDTLNIFDPARLDPADLNDFCGTCHRSTQDVLESGVHGILDLRFQPYRLEKSRCYDPTDKRIACLACHDPHVDLSTEPKSYDSKCRACHAPRGAATSAEGKIRSCPVASRDCVRCHMPKLELPGAHYKFTDHDIRIFRRDEPYPD